MTPAEYNAHASAWYRKQRREQERVAMLCKFSARAKAECSISDFMGPFADDEFGGAAE